MAASIAAVLLGTAGCIGGHASAVERAEVMHLKHDGASFAGIHAVSCDRRGQPVTVHDVTYTAYACTVHGGRSDGGNLAVWWDGRRLHHSCTDLPLPARNDLCFD